jgi:hypothetical protein
MGVDVTNRILFVVLVLIFLIVSCNKNSTSSDNDNSLISVDWSNSYTTTYNYSGGVLSGMNFYINFTITSVSGNLKITEDVTQGEGNKKSITNEVEEDETYSLKAPVSISGAKNCTPNIVTTKIKLSAGNSDPQNISIGCGSNG